MIKLFDKVIYAIVLCLITLTGYCETKIEDIRLWHSPESTRIVFDLNKAVNYQLFSLTNPYRIVIDLDDTKLGIKLDSVSLKQTDISLIRHGYQENNRLRLVFDLKKQMRVKSFNLKPNEQYGDRLVVDLLSTEAISDQNQIVPVRTSQKLARRNFIVAIDAGHGGEDPGASGKQGTYEKHVVLAIAKALANQLKQNTDIKPYLTRTDDYYVGLRQRMSKARKAQADLFISIHADAFKDSRAKGASVFALSTHGASSEAAKWLAEKENRADLIGGVSLDDKDDVLASVLLDLSQTASSEASMLIGNSILKKIKRVSALHSKHVQTAGFAVLKAPDIPSILIETGFISNPEGERNLRSSYFQRKMAKAIMDGIEQYFKGKPKPLMLTKEKEKYKVQKGDSLSRIAQAKNTTIAQLKSLNQLKSDEIAVGQVLQIP